MSVPVGPLCCATLTSIAGFRERTCKKRAKVERDGRHYCGMHDPVFAKQRKEKFIATENAKLERNRATRAEAEKSRIEQERRADGFLKLVRGLRQILARGFASEADVRAIVRDILEEVGEWPRKS